MSTTATDKAKASIMKDKGCILKDANRSILDKGTASILNPREKQEA